MAYHSYDELNKRIDFNLLEKISFWSDDADDDNNIGEYFSDFGKFKEKMERDIYLILWRKWSWKTALKKFFSYEIKKISPETRFVREISLTDLPNKKDIFSWKEDLSYLWKFVILIELMKLLVEDNTVSIEDRSNFTEFLKENGYLLTNSSDLIRRIILKSRVIVWAIAQKLWMWTLWEGGWIPEAKYEKILPELENLIVDAFVEGHEYYILFDRLDDDYNAVVNSTNYLNAIAYFIKQVRAINLNLSKLGKKVKLIVFLRADIFKDELIKKIGDANKLDDKKLEIKWWEWDSVDANNNLREMCERRAQFSLQSNKLPFDDEILSYIIDRTFFRPRDVIKFFKKLQDTRDILRAEEAYSDWLKNEITDEISVELPIIDKVYDILQRIGYQTFTMSQFKDRYSDISLSEEPEFILKKLYDFSVVGNIDDEGRVNFKYRDWREIDLRKKFIIHRWLHKCLQLRNSKYWGEETECNISNKPVFRHSLR